MTSSPRQIRWHRPLRDVPPRVGIMAVEATPRDAQLPSAEAVTPFDVEIQTLLRVGVPIAEDVTTAKELAIELLKLVAEVEHALMAQYLYTAVSVSDDDASRPHRRELLNVAIQEMGHLATVQNVLLLLGGPSALHLQRDLYRTASEKNPLPFVLEPLSRATLAKDVAVEMPAKVPCGLAGKVDGLVDLAKQSAGVELHRVGAIYTMLRWMFLPAVTAREWVDLESVVRLPPEPHVTDVDLKAVSEVARFEARGDEWPATVPNFIVETPHTCAEVVTALEKIAAQGEGLSQSERSHFSTFLDLVNAFDDGQITTRRLARSPTLGGGHGALGGETISHAYTLAWGTVFSLQYTLLVLTLLHAFRTARSEDGSPGLRERLVELALRGMKRVIVPVSEICASLPLRHDDPALAGPPYDLDPAVLAVDEQNDDLPSRHLKLLDVLANQYASIQQSAEFESRPGDAIPLQNLRNEDRRRHDVFSPPPPGT